jgi:hypothetical protein
MDKKGRMEGQMAATQSGQQGTLFIKKHLPSACRLKNEKSAASGAFSRGLQPRAVAQ